MRPVTSTLLVPLLLFAGCGGPQTSQANNGQANISNDARTADNAVASNLQFRLSLGDAAKVIHERHVGMENIGKSGKAVNRELTGSSPDLGVIRSGAQQIAELSRQASDWFAADTGPEVGKTGAKPAIWQNPQDFAMKLHNFQAAAAAFNAASASGDLPRIRARFADLQGTCKACHVTYRAEMHH